MDKAMADLLGYAKRNPGLLQAFRQLAESLEGKSMEEQRAEAREYDREKAEWEAEIAGLNRLAFSAAAHSPDEWVREVLDEIDEPEIQAVPDSRPSPEARLLQAERAELNQAAVVAAQSRDDDAPKLDRPARRAVEAALSYLAKWPESAWAQGCDSVEGFYDRVLDLMDEGIWDSWDAAMATRKLYYAAVKAVMYDLFGLEQGREREIEIVRSRDEAETTIQDMEDYFQMEFDQWLVAADSQLVGEPLGTLSFQEGKKWITIHNFASGYGRFVDSLAERAQEKEDRKAAKAAKMKEFLRARQARAKGKK